MLRGARVYAAVEYADTHGHEVLASLWDGLRAEITFQFRLYRRTRGFFSFLGDRLHSEKRLSQVASFDFFENRYKIQRDGRIVGSYRSEAEFLEAFFTLPQTEITELGGQMEVDYYLMARVRMMPVKIITPLNIITLFSSESSFTTPWIEADLKP